VPDVSPVASHTFEGIACVLTAASIVGKELGRKHCAQLKVVVEQLNRKIFIYVTGCPC
jgi:hypothetical protein